MTFTSCKKVSFLFLFFFCLIGGISYAQETSGTVDTKAGLTFKPLPPDTVAIVKSNLVTHVPSAIAKGELGLTAIFLTGFLGGLAALLLPCIFPMLPLTVGFFTKRNSNKKKSIIDALVYGFSIIFIYVGLGLLITIVFGANALNALSTNGIFNFLFFVLLVLFASSFLGAFELTLPNKWINKAEENTNRKGFTGIFFMAAVLALVSFSCTGPIIGTLLVQAATSGARLGPAVGMFGFSLALALPFVLFALFPSLMNGLPKSGGWLNSVKVVLGFLELGLSLKFLSNVDLTYHWHLFDREVFLVLWIVLSLLTGLYLLGKLRFIYDSPLSYLSVPRLFLAIIALSFSAYLVPGLWGAPLKSIAAFLPPQSSQDFDLYTPTLGANIPAAAKNTDELRPAVHKYSNLFDRPLNLDPFFDYKEGLAYARKVHLPILIDFTGHACVNCRKMEATVWPDRRILPLIKNNYVLIQLYVDDKTVLEPEEQYTSDFSHRRITTIGELNSDIQARRFNTNSQPYYVLLDPVTEIPLVEPEGALYEPDAYFKYLRLGIGKFR